MAKNNAQVISEYVVKLGASMDNNSLNQFLTALDTTKMRAMGLTAAIGALTTGIYKFISSITKQQFEMERLAYQKQKSIKDTWAEQQALKAMGKTLNEINQDKALKSMYDDLVKFNKGLELPNADRAFEKVRSLQGAFYKLKSGVNYAIQAIGNQVLVNLEEPINRITEKVGNIAEWLKNNLTNVATKLGSLITAFSKGIIAIVEGIEKIGKWISSLPDSIKIVAAALTGVIALLSSGPIGKIIAAITLIGDIIHDAEVYKWNQQNTDIFFAEDGSPTKSLENAMKDENGDPILFKVPVGLEPIWDVTIGKKGGNLTDVISGFGEKVGKGAGDLINGAFEEISKAVSGASEGGIASTTLDAIKGIVIGFVKLIVTTIKTIEFEDFGGAIGDIVT